MAAARLTVEVVHDADAQRFTATVDRHRAVLVYQRLPGVLVIPSVVVPPPIEGRGIAGALVRAALDWAKAEGWSVRPVCPYVAAWLRRHPGYAPVDGG